MIYYNAIAAFFLTEVKKIYHVIVLTPNLIIVINIMYLKKLK